MCRQEGRQTTVVSRCGSSRWGVKGNRDLPTENSSPIHSHSRPFTPKEHPLPRGSPVCQPCLSSLCRPHPDPCPWDCVLRLVGVGQGPQPDQYRALQSLRGAFAGPCLLEWGKRPSSLPITAAASPACVLHKAQVSQLHVTQLTAEAAWMPVGVHGLDHASNDKLAWKRRDLSCQSGPIPPLVPPKSYVPGAPPSSALSKHPSFKDLKCIAQKDRMRQ